MKKTITFILLLVILLLSAVGCAGNKKNSSDVESASVFSKTEATDSSDVILENDTEEYDKSVTGTVPQGKKDQSAETQSTNDTGTNPPDQSNITPPTESSNSSATQTTPSDPSDFIKDNEGIELPMDFFD